MTDRRFLDYDPTTINTTISLDDLQSAGACEGGQTAFVSAAIGACGVPSEVLPYLDPCAIDMDLSEESTWDEVDNQHGANPDFFGKAGACGIVYLLARYADPDGRLWSEVQSEMEDREVPTEPGDGHRHHWYQGIVDAVDEDQCTADARVTEYNRVTGGARGIPVRIGSYVRVDGSWYRVSSTVDEDGDLGIEGHPSRSYVAARDVRAWAATEADTQAPPEPSPIDIMRTMACGWSMRPTVPLLGSDTRFYLLSNGDAQHTVGAIRADIARSIQGTHERLAYLRWAPDSYYRSGPLNHGNHPAHADTVVNTKALEDLQFLLSGRLVYAGQETVGPQNAVWLYDRHDPSGDPIAAIMPMSEPCPEGSTLPGDWTAPLS